MGHISVFLSIRIDICPSILPSLRASIRHRGARNYIEHRCDAFISAISRRSCHCILFLSLPHIWSQMRSSVLSFRYFDCLYYGVRMFSHSPRLRHFSLCLSSASSLTIICIVIILLRSLYRPQYCPKCCNSIFNRQSRPDARSRMC